METLTSHDVYVLETGPGGRQIVVARGGYYLAIDARQRRRLHNPGLVPDAISPSGHVCYWRLRLGAVEELLDTWRVPGR